MASKVSSFVMASRHKRSKSGSFPEKNRLPEDGSHPDDSCRGNKLNKKPSPCTETHHSLKQEIMLLEKRLQDQFKVRYASEKALGYRSCQDNGNDHVSMPKSASELVKEIVTLELDVACLEQYLLTLYRKAFDHQVSSVSSCITDKNPVTRLVTPKRRLLEIPTPDTVTAKKMEVSAVRSRQELASGLSEEEKSVDSGVQRCHSTMSQCSVVFAVRNSTPEDLSLKAVRACHSQPMSMLEYAQKSETSIVSLAEYLGTDFSDHVPETPNKLSEDMVRCMSVIYCKLADSSSGHQGSPSLVSSSSSKSGFSPQDCRDPGSPGLRNGSSFETGRRSSWRSHRPKPCPNKLLLFPGRGRNNCAQPSQELEDIRRKKGEVNDDQACKKNSSKVANANANSAVEAEQGGESSAPKSYRKRPRKGIPHRAPFF